MTKFQKIIYKTAKIICEDRPKNTISCYKARLKGAKIRKESFECILEEYRWFKKNHEWHKAYYWIWNEEKGCVEWIDKHTKQVITEEIKRKFWNE